MLEDDDTLHLTGFAEVEEVLKSPLCQQASHQQSTAFYGDSLLLLEGERHLDRRRREQVLFSRDALVSYERAVLLRAVDRCIAELPRDAAGSARTDLVPLVERILLQIAAAIIGLDGVDSPDVTDRLGAYVAHISEGAHVEWSTRDHDEVLRETLRVKDAFVQDFFAPAWARRVALAEAANAAGAEASSTSTLTPDLLTLLALQAAPTDDPDPDLPVRETILYLMASTQTTSHATPHVVMELSTWLDEHPSDAAKVTDPDFLRRAAAEALRLHTAVPALLRRANGDVTLASGRHIPAGTRIALDLAAANTDPTVWGPAAERFDPWREASGGQVRQRPWGLAFGSGQHVCIGRPLVTGLSNRTDTAGMETLGMLVQIVAALYRAGVELDPDPDQLPRLNSRSVQGYYESFPVRFTFKKR